MSLAPASFIHATAVVIGEAGVLLRGASGTGKSSLALLLIADAQRRGRFARLVGDDRVSLATVNRQVVARPHAAIAGMIECRSLDLVRIEFEPACVVRLVVDLGFEPVPRLPDPDGRVALVDNLLVPHLLLKAPHSSMAPHLILRKLDGC